VSWHSHKVQWGKAVGSQVTVLHHTLRVGGLVFNMFLLETLIATQLVSKFPVLWLFTIFTKAPPVYPTLGHSFVALILPCNYPKTSQEVSFHH